MFLVWGDNTLARRLANELVNTYGVPVTVIVRSADADQAPEIADLEPDTGDPDLRPVLVAAARLTPDVLIRAGVADATAVALVERDDVANVDAAMMVRELNPTARIVVRVFNEVRLIVVATRAGLAGLLAQTRPNPNAPPLPEPQPLRLLTWPRPAPDGDAP
ncbi:MAG TPA: NAD-binding protein [Asanoa sp.]|nr:NAD-binding protein [Asanoa sp.]